MSTVVCQSIQSYFETQLVSLKLKSSVSETSTSGWASIQDLKETSTTQNEYVHPSAKRSPMLSDKSLEMCTESLGSETGTTMSYEDFFSTPSSASSRTVAMERRRPLCAVLSRKAGYQNLPPPLTTISGENRIRVQPCRESGRLVMTAVSTPMRRSNILVERSNGRLTMCLLEEGSGEDLNEETESGDLEEDEEEEANECSDVVLEECVEEEENECSDVVLEECAEEEEENECDGVPLEEGRNGRNMKVGVNFGTGEFQRVRRCKEGGGVGRRRLISWERGTFWVAT